MDDPVVLVTGANGFVGTWIVKSLIKQGYRVHAVLRREPSLNHPVFHAHVQRSLINLAQVDERRMYELIERSAPVAVIHCAALTDTAFCERHPSLVYVVNAAATRLLARACARHGVHCTFLSSDHVFDGKGLAYQVYREEDSAHPMTFYGVSKWQGEIAVQEEYGARGGWTICRSGVVYGSSDNRGARAGQVGGWLARLRRHQTVETIQNQTFSPTYVENLAGMVVELTIRRLDGIYHTAGSSLTDQYTFVLTLAHMHGYPEELVVPVTGIKASRIVPQQGHTGLCIEKVRETLGWSPYTLEEGMSHWQQYLLQHSE